MFKRQQSVNNLLTDTPLLRVSKEEFIEAYINDQFETDYPVIDIDRITLHIEAIMIVHRIAQIKMPTWLTRGLVSDIESEMDRIVNLSNGPQ